MTTTTFTLSTGGTGGTDATFIKDDTPTTNYGTDGFIEMFQWAAGDYGNALIRFTGVAAAIPPGSTISSVTLRLRVFASYGSAAGYTIKAYKLLRAFVESQATWNIYSTSNNWGTAGGTGAADSSATESASTVVGDPATDAWIEWSGSGLVADVQAAVDASAEPQWTMRRTDAVGAATRQFYSDDSGADGYYPELVVVWTAASSTKCNPMSGRGGAAAQPLA